MEIISKQRKVSKAPIIIYVIGVCIITSILFSAIHWEINTKSPAFWIGCIFVICIILFLFTPFFSETTIKEIRVNPKEIQVDYPKNKIYTFSYQDISKFSSTRVRQQGKSGPISDGYSITTIHLKNGKEINISQNEFENYSQIIASIGHNLRNYNS